MQLFVYEVLCRDSVRISFNSYSVKRILVLNFENVGMVFLKVQETY